jgi:CRP-like cAMP-binding protein
MVSNPLYLQQNRKRVWFIMKMMKENLVLAQKITSGCPLFAGISPADAERLLDCLEGLSRKYKKNSFVFMAGDKALFLGLVLRGSLLIINYDFWGNRRIIERIDQNRLFGAAFAFAKTEELPVSVIAAEASEVLLIPVKKIVFSCPRACSFHSVFISNILLNLAQNNIKLIETMEHITCPTTREKLLSYLSSQAQKNKSEDFDIPFNRQELADYLSVERSAMSAELGRMRDGGILSFKKNHFTLLKEMFSTNIE